MYIHVQVRRFTDGSWFLLLPVVVLMIVGAVGVFFSAAARVYVVPAVAGAGVAVLLVMLFMFILRPNGQAVENFTTQLQGAANSRYGLSLTLDEAEHLVSQFVSPEQLAESKMTAVVAPRPVLGSLNTIIDGRLREVWLTSPKDKIWVLSTADDRGVLTELPVVDGGKPVEDVPEMTTDTTSIPVAQQPPTATEDDERGQTPLA